MTIALTAQIVPTISIVGTPLLPNLAPIQALVDQAAASATAAAASQAAAASSASAAAASQTAAAISETNAAASAAAAASSAAGLANALNSAQYITAAASSDLGAERVATNDDITWDFGTAAQAKAKIGASKVTAEKLATSSLGPRVGMINGKLVQTRASNAETFAIKTLAGNDPSATDPVYFVFQDGAGAFVVRTVTAALSLTISSGSTLGASNGVPFRIWIVAADDAGTVRLAAVKTANTSSTTPSIMALHEWSVYSSTAEGGAGAADSAQTLYSGTAFSSKYICLIGFGDWDGGLATAGTWNTAPTRTITFGPGVPRPGDTVQRKEGSVSAAGSANTSTSYTDTALSVAITPTVAVNGVMVEAYGTQTPTGANSVASRMVRSSTQIGNNMLTSGGVTVGVAMKGLDFPATASSTTYKVQDKTFNAATSSTWPNGDTGVMATILATEIMA